MSEQTTEDPLLGRLLDGKYQIETRIGVGGMATVYLARRKHIGDRVAVKVLNTGAPLGEVDLQRFELEARIAAKIKHPNIVSVFDFGSTDGLMYLVMELLEGSSLEKELEQKGALGLDRTLELIQPVCEAVNAAHAEGLIHRDLKPSNILLHRLKDGSEIVKVVDFGVAKLTNINDTAYKERLTKTGYLVGTPHYMSPEQIREQDVSLQCDIYSLGVIIYEMLTGQLPFNAENVIDLLLAHIETPASSMRSIKPEIPEGVDEAVLRSLEKEPAKRQQSARELFQQIYAGARGEPYSGEHRMTPRALPLPRSTTGHHYIHPSSSQKLRRTNTMVYDSLTGLYNSVFMSLRLDNELQHCKATGERVSVILFGLDGFKTVNQRYGFVVGDRVLKEFGEWLGGAAPEHAVLGRYRGDEFLMVLPKTDGKTALRLGAEILERTRTELSFNLDELQQALKLQVSAAVAQFPGDGESSSELIEQASAGLKYAKSRGRGQIEWLKHVQTLTQMGPSSNWEVFIGRRSELDKLNREFERVLMNQSRSVYITGGTGAGKKRLAEEFRRLLSGKDITFLRGRFYASSQATPCKTIYDSLHAHLAPMMEEHPEQMRDLFAGLTERVMKDFQEGESFRFFNSTVQTGTEQEKYALFDYMSKIFLGLARHRPLILFLEDMQWVDPLSLELLTYLTNQAQQSRLMMVGCARTEGLADKHPLRVWLRNSSRGSSETIELQPFTQEEVELYVESVFPRSIFHPTTIRQLYRETAGNPYFLAEIVRHLVDEGQIVFRDGVWRCAETESLPLPRSVIDVVEGMLGRLESETADLFSRVAVLGEEFSFDLIQAVTKLEEDDLLHHIDAGLKAQVIIERADSSGEEVYSFSHGILRRVLYGQLNRRTRRSLHASAGEAIERLYPEKAGELLEHFHASGDYERCLRYALSAGASALKDTQIDNALKYYAWGEEAAEKLGLFADNLETEGATLARLELGYGELLVVTGKAEAAMQRMETALALAGGDQRLEAACLTGLAEACEALGRYHLALDYCERATAIAKQLQDHATMAACMCVTGVARDRLGEHDQGIAELERACEYARAHAQTRYEAKALQEMAYMLVRRGLYRRALGAVEQSLALAKKAQAPILEMIALSIKGHLFFQQRDFEQARQAFEQALRMAGRLNRQRGQAIELYNCGELHRLQGNYRQAIDLIQRSIELAREVGERQFEALARASLGFIFKASDSLDQALESLKLSLQHLRDAGNRTAEVAVLAAIAEIHLERQQLADAEYYARQTSAIAEQLSGSAVLWQSHYLNARLHIARGNRGQALAELRASVGYIEQMCEELTVPRETFLADKQEVYNLLVRLVEECD